MMATSTSDMSFWISFFKGAGIPAGDAANYAVTFTDHRITRAMLLDLTKDYLNDMSITILGDVIAILKHAKTVFNQDVRDKALRETSVPEVVLTSGRRSTPASRTIGHYLSGSDRSTSPLLTPSPKLSKELSARLGTVVSDVKLNADIVYPKTHTVPPEVVPVPKRRRVFPEDKANYTVELPKASSEKTQTALALQRSQAELKRIRADEDKKRNLDRKQSVFSRLGSEKSKLTVMSSSEPTVTITGLGSISVLPSSSSQQSIFARLGGKTTVKRPATSTVTFDDEDDEVIKSGPTLEYAGVLKTPPEKKAKLETAKKLAKTAIKTLAKVKAPEPETEGVLARGSGKTDIRLRLGPKAAEVSSTTQTKPVSAGKSAKKNVTNAQSTSKEKMETITITVETKKPKPSSITKKSNVSSSDVFSRLGKLK